MCASSIMQTVLGFIDSTKGSINIIILAMVVMVPFTYSTGCTTREFKEAYTSGPLTFRSPGYGYFESIQGNYDNNLYCEVLFEASYEGDTVKLTVEAADLEPRSHPSGTCLDKVTVYDGSSVTSGVLGIFCGSETPVYESTGRSILLVFETNSHNRGNYRGFKLEYMSIDRGGFDDYMSSSGVGAGTIVAAVIPAVIIYGIIFYVVYRRCKYAQRVRRNLEATGHTPEDLRMAMVNVLDQASRGPLTQGQGHGRPAPYGSGSAGLQQAVIDSMHASSRGGSSQEHMRRGRVRHPAGDVHHDEREQLQSSVLHSNQRAVSEDGCSGYGSDREEGLALNHNGIIGHRTLGHAASHENIEGVHSSQTLPMFEADPTGVYYAGSVDEHGVLHPPGSHSHLAFPTAPTPSIASSGHAHSYLAQHLEDDRRSRGSSRSRRSPYASGRNSPRDGSHGGSSGRGSPHRHRGHNPAHVYSGSPRLHGYLDSEGQTLTYYGMIDGVGETGAAGHVSTHSGGEDRVDNRQREGGLDVAPPSYGGLVSYGSPAGDNSDSRHRQLGPEMNVPPPSYEDAASGKYSPRFT